MEKKQKRLGSDSYSIVLFLSVLLHLIVFFINLSVGGHNCDELMLAMNAKSLAESLTDVCGERLPIYFDTWIVGGQSPLPTYLAALSVKLLGYSVFAYRLPMLVVSIAGLFAFYGLIHELTENKVIIISSLAFCPTAKKPRNLLGSRALDYLRLMIRKCLAWIFSIILR